MHHAAFHRNWLNAATFGVFELLHPPEQQKFSLRISSRSVMFFYSAIFPENCALPASALFQSQIRRVPRFMRLLIRFGPAIAFSKV
jgi:hypothetical protein